MKQLLVISAIGPYRSRPLSRLARSARECGADILDCRMYLPGGLASVSLLVSGSWDTIAKLEGTLGKLEQEPDFNILCRRTEERVLDKLRIPYSIEIVCVDKTGIIDEVTEYMQKSEIDIQDFFSNTYQNPHADTTLLSIHMTVNIPSDNSISLVRSEFLDFCDRMNMDAIMEPVKGL